VSERGLSLPLADRLFGWGRRSDIVGTPSAVRALVADQPGERVLSTKAFSRFLSALKHRGAPVLLDLGPVVGANVSCFGERLGCKIFVEDLYADIEMHVRTGQVNNLAEFLKTRFPQPDESVDGIVCWDVLDYLDKKAAPVLAQELTRLLRPGGALLAFFATVANPAAEYTRFQVVNESTLRLRGYPAARGRQQVFVNRDINRMFDRLTVSDSFLLLGKTREMVFRKPQHAKLEESKPKDSTRKEIATSDAS
jgi:predicted SAM-dependent methyltransferase